MNRENAKKKQERRTERIVVLQRKTSVKVAKGGRGGDVTKTSIVWTVDRTDAQG